MGSKECEDQIQLTPSPVRSNSSSSRSCRLENGSYQAIPAQMEEEVGMPTHMHATDSVVSNKPSGTNQSILGSIEKEDGLVNTNGGDQETSKACTLSCQHCGKQFTKSWALKVHLRIHTGTRPHICDLCGKAFTQSGDLQRHIRVHTGEKPFKCEFCSRGFSRMITRRHHQVVCKDRPKDQKLFNSRLLTCYLCDITFSRSCDLQKHLRGHKHPFSTSQVHRPTVNWNQRRFNSYQAKHIDDYSDQLVAGDSGVHVVSSAELEKEASDGHEGTDLSDVTRSLDVTGGNEYLGRNKVSGNHKTVVRESESVIGDAFNVMEVVDGPQTVRSVDTVAPCSPDIVILKDVNNSEVAIDINAAPLNEDLEVITCDEFGRSSETPEAPVHTDRSAEAPFTSTRKAKCHICGRIFRTMSTLDKHLHLHDILQRRTNRGQNPGTRSIEVNTYASTLEDERSSQSSGFGYSYGGLGFGRQSLESDSGTTQSVEAHRSSIVKRRNHPFERPRDSKKDQVTSRERTDKGLPITRETISTTRREIQTGVINPVLPYNQRLSSPSSNTVYTRTNDDHSVQTMTSRGTAYSHTSNSQQRASFSETELVLKIRLADLDDKDFIEVDLDHDELTFDNLVETCCRELALDRSQVVKIRKLPNTIIRRDKDVTRLNSYQELEVVFD